MSVTLEALSKDWLGLSQDYRPSAFWFWNDGMDESRMRERLDAMARARIREVLFHPIHGLEIEYLSGHYFDRLRYGLGLARERGLKVWIYDEFGWPSGNAGGRLLREHPEHRGWYLEFSRSDAGVVTAEPVQSLMVLDNTVGAPWAQSEGGYVDTLNSEAVSCFIAMTYERVFQECRDYFDGTIAGFFTDEPTTMVPRCRGNNFGPWAAVGLPWTPKLPEQFAARHGYDITSRYVELAGDAPGKIKADYYSIVKDLYSEAFYGQIGQWCRDHNIKFTGHAGEDYLPMHTRYSGSLYQCLKHMDEPGIDFLGATPEPEDRFIEQVCISSIARHSGKRRVFCEAFGLTPLDVRPADLLRRAELFGIHGIDDIALMGFHESLDGFRKQIYWPPYFEEAPWWPFYAEFRDAFARSVALPSLGNRRARYAILYPQEALEQYDLFADQYCDPITDVIRRIALAVYAAGETFEFVFPENLSDAVAKNGLLVLPHASYEKLIVPTDLAVSETTRQVVASLSSNGAEILVLPADAIVSALLSVLPSWHDRLRIEHNGLPGDIRIYEFDYPDGSLFSIRNVTRHALTVTIRSSKNLSEWESGTGEISEHNGGSCRSLAAHATKYFSLTPEPLFEYITTREHSLEQVQCAWQVSPQGGNLSRLFDLRVKDTRLNGQHAETRFEGSFNCTQLLDTIGIVFEDAHLAALSINGLPVSLEHATIASGWDISCREVNIHSFVRPGHNVVSGTLRFAPGEVRIVSEAFYHIATEPLVDVFVVGSFKNLANKLSPDMGEPVSFPVDFRQAGYENFSGIVSLIGEVCLRAVQCERIIGLAFELFADDCAELRIDGSLIGRRIRPPYSFDLSPLVPGSHWIELRVSTVSANLFGKPSTSGVRSAAWVVGAL